jgi:putative flippase GtrA
VRAHGEDELLTAVGEVVRRVRTSRRAVRVTRYALGSVVALAASEIAFVLCYTTGVVGTTAASVIAFVAGAIPNYVLNRTWAWQRRGRVHVGREVFGYAVVSLISLATAAASTGWVNHAAPSITTSHLQRTALVAGTYMATYGVLFVLKFVAFELVIFARPVSPPRPPDDPRETQPIGEVATFFG